MVVVRFWRILPCDDESVEASSYGIFYDDIDVRTRACLVTMEQILCLDVLA